MTTLSTPSPPRSGARYQSLEPSAPGLPAPPLTGLPAEAVDRVGAGTDQLEVVADVAGVEACELQQADLLRWCPRLGLPAANPNSRGAGAD